MLPENNHDLMEPGCNIILDRAVFVPRVHHTRETAQTA
jgi:hypothetical protein